MSHDHNHGNSEGLSSFIWTYVFSRDHKIIGLQFLFSTLLWFLVGGLLALGIRWQLAWPWSNMPVIGPMRTRCQTWSSPMATFWISDSIPCSRHF